MTLRDRDKSDIVGRRLQNQNLLVIRVSKAFDMDDEVL